MALILQSAVERIQNDIARLETVSNSEFEEEAQFLIGTETYKILRQNGMDRWRMTAEIRRRLIEESQSPPAVEMLLFKDLAGQCHD